jgi:hypothetical protein
MSAFWGDADIDRSPLCGGLAGLAVGGRRQEAAAATIRLLSLAKIWAQMAGHNAAGAAQGGPGLEECRHAHGRPRD